MIHPRRLKGSSANIARYYTVGDYYSKGGLEPSEWGGRIAAELGLEGPVDPQTFRDLLAGRVNDQQLGRHRADGEIQHHPGWDFAVNAPKSVSIMALVMEDERISAAHEAAVGSALGYLEEHATLRRREDGGVVHQTTARLLFARFTEHASRELDPHLHTHVVVMNMTNARDGDPMASLETRAMFAEQMVAGQVYRNALAHDLRRLGYEIESDPRSGLFEIKGVPQALITELSQRAEQIDAHAREHGLTGQAARRQSFYETRRGKEKAGLDALHAVWTARSAPHRDALYDTLSSAKAREDRSIAVEAMAARRATLFGIRQAETREAVNNLGRMVRLGLASHVGEVRLDDLRPLLAEHEVRAKLLATREPTGDHILTRGRTTRATARVELALSQHLALALDDARPIASAERLLRVFEHFGLTPQQEQALTQIAMSRDRVSGIHGVAGAGKSTLARALKQAAEPGTVVTALAPTSSAAANLGQTADIDFRTVASLIAGGGRGLGSSDVLVLDEAGQLGNRQALRVLEISRQTGARLILLGDNKQTGAIEQGKAFWLMQRLGLPTAELTESLRQQTRSMKAAVTQARLGNYAASLEYLDKVTSGDEAAVLAKGLVSEWTRLKPESRLGTNILVLDNATRLIVNAQIRETLKREGVIAAEDTRLQVLTPAGLSDQEKHNARFYSGGQVVTFTQHNAGLGLARGAEYRVLGLGRGANGRQIVRLLDENGRIIRWDPRLGQARHVNVFNTEERDLSQGDRIQWRLATHDLDLKNAERGTVLAVEGARVTIKWDRGEHIQSIDLEAHKTWDHGYAETVYSAQSKTYARAYVLAPVNAGLVNAQNYYTAITRARFGVKLWTEDPHRLIDKLIRFSGEKTSSLEALGRLDRDRASRFGLRHAEALDRLRQEQVRARVEHRDVQLERRLDQKGVRRDLPTRIATGARSIAEMLDDLLVRILHPSSLERPVVEPPPAKDFTSTGRDAAHGQRDR
ncbi:MobF family relaxase [Sphingomonas sp. BIUV-7]|uniref:MobF family relaxase n=1 Tax=Sphingomonas natans TaxID=3063330 RepID=A0ABT8YAJ2_9SPHN|nr:MobF family relaxase [Sphingomonas sp. BIUV-7]MDO6415341.1 MobF family relaxase [Sphingomonas sp. BIUV-7]